ncbi:MAG: hypothetical protein Fur0041_05810 [Bacteroidia bacterium]
MRVLLTVILSICFSLIKGQNKSQIDSLEGLLKTEKDVIKRGAILNKLAFEYKASEPLKARAYAREAWKIGAKKGDAKLQADALHKEGISYYYVDSYDTALVLYHRSLNLSRKTGDSLLTAQAYTGIGNVYRLMGVNDTALIYLSAALNIYIAANDAEHTAYCESTIGDVYLFSSSFDKAMEYHTKSLESAQKSGNKRLQAFNYASIGNNYHMQGKFNKAIETHQKAIKIADEIGEINIKTGSLGTIADAYTMLYNYPKAIECFLQALDITEKTNDKHNMAFIYNGMSELYLKQRDTLTAIQWLDKSTNLSKEIGDYNRTSYNLLSMAKIKHFSHDTTGARILADEALQMSVQYNYPGHNAAALRMKALLIHEQKKFKEAHLLFEKALNIFTTIGDQQGVAETKLPMMKNLIALGNNAEAVKLGEEGLKISEDIDAPLLQVGFAELLWHTYQKMNNSSKALFYAELYIRLKDKYNNEENTRRQTELLLQYNFDKEKEKEKVIQEQKDAVQKAQLRQQQIIIYAASVAMILLLALAFFIFHSYKQKQKANEIITHQKKIVEEINREITDSINYAKNIQGAMLPAPNAISSLFSDYFIFFRPRDIVSGDFYWTGERDSKKFFAVADCTGHGVPGGFMSMLGITLLNEILSEKGITSPDKMLNELRSMIINSLNRDKKDGDTLAKDGMDIALCCIDTRTNELTFSGANNSLYIILNNRLTELHPDKQPVGVHETTQPFSLQSYRLQGGELIVATSDGYPDQFGGPKGKKFMYKNFRNLLVEHSDKQTDEIRSTLEKTFDSWKEHHAQIDDICVMGIRV